MPGMHDREDDIPPPSEVEDTEIDGDDESTDKEEDSFLEPYYESKDSTGCFTGSCGEFWDIFRIIASVDVRYNSNPERHDGVRTLLGRKGNSVALNARFGLCVVEGDGVGYMTEVLFRTPTPLILDFLYHRVEKEGTEDFTLFYAGLLSQIVYDSPLELMLGAQVVFPAEDGKEVLSGAGFELLCQYSFRNRLGAAVDYRLTWIRNLPLQRGEFRLSWISAPVELYAGYNYLRNCGGDFISGPCAGIGLFF